MWVCQVPNGSGATLARPADVHAKVVMQNEIGPISQNNGGAVIGCDIGPEREAQCGDLALSPGAVE
jgi:hypothetical protein